MTIENLLNQQQIDIKLTKLILYSYILKHLNAEEIKVQNSTK